MKKINLKTKDRLEAIKYLAMSIQDTKNKKLSELRNLARNIEVLADTKLLKSLNKGIQDLNEGRYTVFTSENHGGAN